MEIAKQAEEMAEAFMLTRPLVPDDFPESLATRLREKDERLTAGFAQTAQSSDSEERSIRLGWYVEVIEKWLRESSTMTT